MKTTIRKRHDGSIFIILLLTLILGVALPQTASAHATLLKATPGQGDHLEKSPSKVVLTFNERLGDNLFKLQVLDSNGKSVTDHKASLSQKHRKLMLEIPPLRDGVYTVTYKVISADGHPVSSSYTFSIGKTGATDGSMQTSSQQGHHHSGGSFLVRIGYDLALLFLTGWTLWGFLFPKDSEEVRQTYRGASQFLKGFYLFMLLGWGFVEFSELLSGFGPGKMVPLFFSSAVGLTFLVSLLLAILSFWILGRSKWIDGSWVGILLAAEAFNGHAFAFQPTALTLFLDFVHLVTAAIWSGGILYLIYFWKKHPAHVKAFLPVFSRAALVSMILLVITGTLNTFLFLPTIKDVLYTWWGKLLMLKTAIVIAVIVTAALIRSVMKKKGIEKIGPLVKLDFTLMIAILVIVGIFTYLNPTPTNEPLIWTSSKNHITVTAKVMPKVPSISNNFTVVMKIPKKPHQIRLVLKDLDKKGLAPISKIMKVVTHKNNDFTFRTKQNIPFPGEWKIKVYVLDSHDNVTLFEKKTRIFKEEGDHSK